MNTNLKFISFRNEYDLKELTEKGAISMTLNANNTTLFDLAKDYFKSDSAIWCYIIDNVPFEKDSYFGNTIKVEFKPTDKYLKFTPNRHCMLHQGADIVMERLWDNFITEDMTSEDIRQNCLNFMRNEFCCDDNFLEYCKTEKSPDGIYIGLVPHIKADEIISIEHMQ